MGKRLRVGMDISQLTHQGGVSIYNYHLAQQLSRIENLDMVYFYSSLRKSYKGNLRNVKSYRLPPTIFEMLFNRWRNINIEKFIGSIDIFHSSDWTQPPTKAKKATTFHDMVPLMYPQWSHPKIVAVHKRRLKLVEQEIDEVIAVSESTKRDLLKISHIPKNKITVIYEGPTIPSSLRLQGEALEREQRKFKEKYGLPEKFVLAIGGVGERKNLKRIKEACKDYNLVIAGETLPWLSMEELRLLYQSAEILVYCSLYEGFGLPILDAQVCGCPVVTSNISSMPEIAGDGVILVDPHSIEDIRRGIREIRGIRKDLIMKGFNNVKKFSWEKAAQQTAVVYQKLVYPSDNP